MELATVSAIALPFTKYCANPPIAELAAFNGCTSNSASFIPGHETFVLFGYSKAFDATISKSGGSNSVTYRLDFHS